MKRKIIKIDEAKCNGCGLCIPNCPEGAMQIIDGKAKLVNDAFCDGLGACLGHCPEGAISVEEREAASYDEDEVIKNIAAEGNETIKEHLHHLKEHNQLGDLEKAVAYLEKNNIPVPKIDNPEVKKMPAGCPGMQSMSLKKNKDTTRQNPNASSALTNWPLQMHLINPASPHFVKSDLLIAADCSAFAAGNFHHEFLKNKTLTIACPKLDTGQDIYLEKVKTLIDEAKVNTITVMTMVVPCCHGLLALVQRAASESENKIPVKHILLSLEGEVLEEKWV